MVQANVVDCASADACSTGITTKNIGGEQLEIKS